MNLSQQPKKVMPTNISWFSFVLSYVSSWNL